MNAPHLTRSILVACLALCVGTSSVVSRTLAAHQFSPKGGARMACCCGKDGRCCGKACCPMPLVPNDKAPVSKRVDEPREPLVTAAAAASIVASPGELGRRLLILADRHNDFHPSLVWLGVRIDC